MQNVSVTVGLVLQLLGEGRFTHMVHEFQQVLPALAPEAGLHMAQKGDVLLSGVRLREQILESLTQRQQDQPVIHRFIPEGHIRSSQSNQSQQNIHSGAISQALKMHCHS